MNTDVIRLRVEESPVKFGGRARVNISVIEDSEMEEGHLAVISSAHRDILVNIYSDELMDDGKIKLRKEDIDKLKIDEDDEVELRIHERLLNQNFLDKLL